MNKKRINKILTLLIFSLSLGSCSNSPETSPKDFSTIKENYVSYMMKNQSTATYDDKTTEQIKATLSEKEIGGIKTYYFNDINYSFDQDRSSWPAGGHLGRTLQLAVLAKKRNDANLKDIALRCLYHWVYSTYRNTNWWQNEIGANQNLSNIAMFLFDDLSKKGQDALLGKLYESSIYHRPSLATHEGSNLLNYCEMTIKCAAIDRSFDEIDSAIECINKTINQGGKEGYQEDGSFFQHGRLLQTGSYGIEGTTKIANVITMLKGTSKSLPSDKLGIISNFILNGLKPMTYKGMYNYMAVGRAYSRVNSLDVELGSFKASDMKKFSALENMPNREDIDNYVEDVVNKTAKTYSNGVNAYKDSKVLVGNYDNVYMCFKGSDSSATNTECVNHENCLGYNFSYGQNTCVMQTGNEYYNISPLWDYTETPGAVSRRFSNGTMLEKDAAIDEYVKNSLDNGLYEAHLPEINPNTNERCIYNLNKTDDIAYSMTQSVHDITPKNQIGGVEFTSTCFMTEEGMIVLGSGLNNKQQGLSDEEKILHTSLEQCRLNEGDVDPVLSEDRLSVKKDKIVYTSLDNQPLSLNIEDRSFDWQRNNPSLSSKIENGKVMTITLNEERNSHFDHYAYAVQPINKVSTSKIEVIANTPSAAAIKLSDGRIAACFYKNESFTYLDKEYTPSSFNENKGCFEIFN